MVDNDFWHGYLRGLSGAGGSSMLPFPILGRQEDIDTFIYPAGNRTLSYQERLSKDQIRILEILPSDDPTVLVRCELRTYDLPHALEYEALSYRWGDLKEWREIMCDNQVITVTPNLHDALAKLRLPRTRRIIWADALCINQADKDEKAIHVARMDEIYSKAHHVVVWFGHEKDETTQAVVHGIEIIDKRCGKQLALKRSDPIVDWEGSESWLHLPDGDLEKLPWVEFRKLYDNEWFNRMW
jgi:hypothetical protein